MLCVLYPFDPFVESIQYQHNRAGLWEVNPNGSFSPVSDIMVHSEDLSLKANKNAAIDT